MTGQRSVAVVGAGISGLATAYFLLKESRAAGVDLQVSLVEASPKPGGVIESERARDFLLEWGPENFVAFRPLILDLINEVGLGDELIGSNDRIRQTYVLNQGRLQPLPDGMAFLAPVDLKAFWSTSLISARGKLRACLEPLVRPSQGDLSVHEFLRRRLGTELTETVAEPLVSAIYGGDIKKLSLASALPETHHLEQRYGSLWRGMRSSGRRGGGTSQPFFRSLRHGMSDLSAALVQHLDGADIHFDCPVDGVLRNGSRFVVRTGDFEESFDALVLCTPAPAAASLLNGLSETAAGYLQQIEYTQTWLVYLAYSKAEFSHPLPGFGFVVPEKEARVLDACTWVSSKFEGRCPEDSVLLRCAIHNGRHDRQPGSETETIERVEAEVRRILGVSARPGFAKARRAAGDMAQPTVQHSRRLDWIRAELGRIPGLYLSAAYVSGVGVPSCVAHGRLTAQRLVKSLVQPDRN